MEIIKRHILEELRQHLDAQEISLLLGPRQAGKTTLMQMLEKELSPTVFLNLDIEKDEQILSSQAGFVKYLQLELGPKGGYVFIDEIQRKTDAGRFLKGLYDQALPYKFIVSGSGSLELKEKVVESLAGRKRIFEIFPINFFEFLDFKTAYKYEGRLSEWLDLRQEEGQLLLQEYLTFGGYPDVVRADTSEEKILRLDEIYRSYIDRDINSIINIDKPREFGLLFQYLAGVAGYPLNYSSLGKKTTLSSPTVKQYIWYLEKIFMLRMVRPFFQNPQKELVRAPTPYFTDLGIRCLLLHIWEEDSMSFQHLVAQELFRLLPPGAKLRSWRTKAGAEVDFVIGPPTRPIPVEVKFGARNVQKIPTGLKSFIRKYEPEKGWIVHTGGEAETEYQSCKVQLIPFWKVDQIFTPH